MINVSDLTINPASLGKKMVYTETRACHEYKNGERTAAQTGNKYYVVLPDHHYEKIGVRIDGPQQQETIEEGSLVTFENLEVRVFVISGAAQISAKATGIKVVANPNKS